MDSLHRENLSDYQVDVHAKVLDCSLMGNKEAKPKNKITKIGHILQSKTQLIIKY